MKLRRALPFFVVAAGAIILLLGILGVFSTSKETPVPPPEEVKSNNPAEMVIKGFSTEGNDWRLTADEGRMREGVDTDATLTNPVFEMKSPVAGHKERINIRADKGSVGMNLVKKNPTGLDSVQMTGNVRLEVTGDQEHAVLRTESLRIDPEKDLGQTQDKVELLAETQEGKQKITGKGAEIALRQRTVTLLEDIRMELTGPGSSFIPGVGKAGESAVTVISCLGPANADGFKRSLELLGKARLEQGTNQLDADRILVQFSDKPSKNDKRFEVERFSAQGNVSFKGEATGKCDKLVSTPPDGQLVLDGSPAHLSSANNEIEAKRIEVSANGTEVVVPSAGKLAFASPSPNTTERAVMKWSEMLRLDLNEHSAIFRGNVHSTLGTRSIDCQMLSVKLDEKNAEILQWKAQGGVVLSDVGNAGGEPMSAETRELKYDQKSNSIAMAGGSGKQQGPLQNSVNMRYGGMSLHAPRVDAKLAEQSLKSFEARDGVVIDQAATPEKAAMNLRADSFSAAMGPDSQLQQFIAAGHVRVKQLPKADQGAITLSADKVESEMDSSGKPSGYRASGNVVVEREVGTPGEIKVTSIRAPKATARLNDKGELIGFDASGGEVVVQQEDQSAKGESLVWDAVRDEGTLTGSPAQWRQGPNRLYGEKVSFSPSKGNITVIGKRRVEATVLSHEAPGGLPLP